MNSHGRGLTRVQSSFQLSYVFLEGGPACQPCCIVYTSFVKLLNSLSGMIGVD